MVLRRRCSRSFHIVPLKIYILFHLLLSTVVFRRFKMRRKKQFNPVIRNSILYVTFLAILMVVYSTFAVATEMTVTTGGGGGSAQPIATCQDSDGGYNIFQSGNVYLGSTVCSDRCATPTELSNSGGVDELFECFCGNRQASGGVQGNGCSN